MDGVCRAAESSPRGRINEWVLRVPLPPPRTPAVSSATLLEMISAGREFGLNRDSVGGTKGFRLHSAKVHSASQPHGGGGQRAFGLNARSSTSMPTVMSFNRYHDMTQCARCAGCRRSIPEFSILLFPGCVHPTCSVVTADDCNRASSDVQFQPNPLHPAADPGAHLPPLCALRQ